MDAVRAEINKIIADIPRFRFLFPDMENIRIRKLDASETSRRKKEVGKAKTSLATLLSIDREALKDVDPELIEKLRNILGEGSSESKRRRK